MTSGRFWITSAATAGALALLGATACGESAIAPCGTNCSAVEGTYALDFEDGGFTDTGDCTLVPLAPPKGPLELTRRGSELKGQLDGPPLMGTLYNDNTFNLMGTAPTFPDGGLDDSVSLSFSARFIPPPIVRQVPGRDGGTAGDGGTPAVSDGGAAQLTGLFTGTRTRVASGGGNSQRCQVTRRFTATRQP
ncbi:hypothetical protein P2318_18440 [Myxococcaceae bacterium GXIMD 01537]